MSDKPCISEEAFRDMSDVEICVNTTRAIRELTRRNLCPDGYNNLVKIVLDNIDEQKRRDTATTMDWLCNTAKDSPKVHSSLIPLIQPDPSYIRRVQILTTRPSAYLSVVTGNPVKISNIKRLFDGKCDCIKCIIAMGLIDRVDQTYQQFAVPMCNKCIDRYNGTEIVKEGIAYKYKIVLKR